jgi:hypothetical protein
MNMPDSAAICKIHAWLPHHERRWLKLACSARGGLAAIVATDCDFAYAEQII